MKNRNFIYFTFLIAILLSLNYRMAVSQYADNSLKLRMNDNFKKNNLKTDEPSKDSDTTSGWYTPNRGFSLLETKEGSVNFTIMAYIRYLNQSGLDSTYTNSFGRKSIVKRREDIQLNKVNIKFKGWFMDPDFRYNFYVWTSNTSLGALSQVVVAGNLNYKFNKYLNVGAGIDALPTTRSTQGNFPFWLNVDNREIADEFFRGSYTTGIWANGNITDKLLYTAMVGNNLSQFGIDAAQLDAGLNTYSGAITWLPTTGEFGLNSSFGDFENHQKVATRLAGHFTYSEEDRQSQQATTGFDNVQLRLSDGSVIFDPGLFGDGISIEDAVYKMADVDAGIKYKGFSLDGEFFSRWLSNFTGQGIDSLGLNLIRDNGFQTIASYMVVKDRVQLYTSFAQIFGDYGNPWSARLGLNYYPFKSQMVRWNFQYIQLYKCPVGGLSYPYVVGGTGGVFNTDFLINF